MFTISLPRYGYELQFNTSRFIAFYPKSMITTALQSHENTIEITHSSVTPELLQFLYNVMEVGKYPYIDDTCQPTSQEIKAGVNYLCIDLPNVIYNPKYKEILVTYPQINILIKYFNMHSDDPLVLKQTYMNLMYIAVEFDLPELVEYVLDNTTAENHKTFDVNLMNKIVSEPIMLLFISKRHILKVMTDDQLTKLLDYALSYRFTNVLEAYIKEIPGAIDTCQVVYYILDKMLRNMDHYLDNLQMLITTSPYLRSVEQANYYGMMMSCYNGDLKNVKKYHLLLDNARDNLHILYVCTALYRKHWDIAEYLIDEHIEVLEDDEDSGYFMESYFEFLQYSYLFNPSWVTKEGLQVLINKSKYFYGEDDNSYIKDIRNELKSKGINIEI